MSGFCNHYALVLFHLAFFWMMGGQLGDASESRWEGLTLSVQEAQIENRVLSLTLQGDLGTLANNPEAAEEFIFEQYQKAKLANPTLRGIWVYIQTEDGQKILLTELLKEHIPVRIPSGPASQPLGLGLPPVELPYGGSLLGKRIALSPGHGWLFDSVNMRWVFQREFFNIPDCEPCLGIIEDVSNAEIASRYLIPLLLRAGATVWSVRERDSSVFEKILDEDSSEVVLEGPWSMVMSADGFQGDSLFLKANELGRAIYPLRPQTEGSYWVSLWTVAGPDRATDAEVKIFYSGGVAEFHLDQTALGSRWLHLGAYWFAPDGEGRVEIQPGPGSLADQVLSADAVRLGGGFDQTEMGGQPANQTRFLMSAANTTTYFGLPPALHTGRDNTVRPIFAEWMGADAFVSLHSNGGQSNSTGTSTYRHSCETCPDHSPGAACGCDDPPGSKNLQNLIHETILEVLRGHFDPHWQEFMEGELVANLGELRELDLIPGVLVESAFHNGIEKNSEDLLMPDNQALQDPRFRYWLGYAIVAGLARYFNPQAVLLPAVPPEGLSLVHDRQGGLLAEWQPVEGALGYRVRLALEGLGLQEGLVTEETSMVLTGLEPRTLVALQVSAVNEGGEGPPSELAVARYRGHGTFSDVLLISGFDRQDAFLGDGNNRRDQAWAHAQAIASLVDQNVYFDFASNESAISGRVPLQDYSAVIWILGEESTSTDTFDANEQQLLWSYLNAGGSLMASGSEIGWDLVAKGSELDQKFFSLTFGADYRADDSQSYHVSGLGQFAGIDLQIDSGGLGIYPVDSPDCFDPATGILVLQYDNGLGAAVAFERDPGRTLLMGFPFETILDATDRAELIGEVLRFLLPDHTPDDFDSDGLPDDWEFQYGTDPLVPSADQDPDLDGRSNLQEYQEGTDPRHPDNPEEDGGIEGSGEFGENLPNMELAEDSQPEPNPDLDGQEESFDSGVGLESAELEYVGDQGPDMADLGTHETREETGADETIQSEPGSGCGCSQAHVSGLFLWVPALFVLRRRSNQNH